MRNPRTVCLGLSAAIALLLWPGAGAGLAEQAERAKTSYAPVDIQEDFKTTMARMKAAKAAIEQRHRALLEERYDLANRPARDVTMSRGKALQEGVRAKLPPGMTWEKLADLAPEAIREKDLFPKGLLPLPFPNHAEGGMLFPQYHIDEIRKQTGRDLMRFDLDYDLPDHFLPEFPPPVPVRGLRPGEDRQGIRLTPGVSGAGIAYGQAVVRPHGLPQPRTEAMPLP